MEREEAAESAEAAEVVRLRVRDRAAEMSAALGARFEDRLCTAEKRLGDADPGLPRADSDCCRDTGKATERVVGLP